MSGDLMLNIYNLKPETTNIGTDCELKNSPLSELYIQGKLLYAALVKKLANKHFYAGQHQQARFCMMEKCSHTPWRIDSSASKSSDSDSDALPARIYW